MLARSKGNWHYGGMTIHYYLGKVNMFPNARSIAEEQPNVKKLAGLIHKYSKINRASTN